MEVLSLGVLMISMLTLNQLVSAHFELLVLSYERT